MKQNKLFIITALISATLMIVLTGCGGAKVPDTYNYDDLTKYIQVGNYKGLKYDKVSVDVSDSEIQETIDSSLASAQTTKDVKSGTVTNDSTVKIDYVGKINGKKFEGGSGKDVSLNIKENNFISGFASGIVGHKVGDKFDLELTFPSDYSNEEYAGKKATFTITVKSLVKVEKPAYDDAFVKANTEYNTTEEYEAAIKEKLYNEKESKAENTEDQQLFTEIVKNSKVKKYPEAEVNDTYDKTIKTYKDLAKKNNMDYKKFLKTNMGMTEKQFNKNAKTAAKNSVKQELIIRQIAKEQDIKITDKEYDEFLNKLLKDAGYTEDNFKEKTGSTIEEYAENNNLYSSMLYGEVMKKVRKFSSAK